MSDSQRTEVRTQDLLAGSKKRIWLKTREAIREAKKAQRDQACAQRGKPAAPYALEHELKLSPRYARDLLSCRLVEVSGERREGREK